MQAYDSIMCWYFCIWIIDFMLKGKILLSYKNVCSPNNSVICSKCKNEVCKYLKKKKQLKH